TGRGGRGDVEPPKAVRPARSGCMFSFAPAFESGVPFRGSREEAFRSGEARPLAADWPLRVRPRAGYILRPRPLITSFLVPDGAGGPSRLPLRPSALPLHRRGPSCPHSLRPPRPPRAAS